MEQYQRELLISRIICGYLRYWNGSKLLCIYAPTNEVVYESNEIYSKIYNKSLNEGLMTDSDVVRMLIEGGVWSEKQEKDYSDILPKHIEYWKEQLYLNRLVKAQLEKNIKYLAAARDELSRMAHVRHRHDYISCHGVAAYAKAQFIIERSTFLPASKKRYSWSGVSLYRAMVFCQENVIREETLRELSHTSPWDNIWAAGKKNGHLFPKCGVELSTEQQRLILWSGMYDNIREYPDCPSGDIIDNDDMLDGWLSLKRKNKLAGGDAGISNQKIANSDEVFLPARTLAEAKEIDNYNDRAAKLVKKKTMAALDKTGAIADIMLPHMQERLMMEATNKISQGRKKNG